METFVGFFNGHSQTWMTPRSSKSELEQTNYFCTYFSWGYGLNFITLQNYKVYKKFRSCSVRSPKANTCRNNLFACRSACSQVIHACEWPLKTPTNVFIHRFQGIFNANVFSELVAHTKSKMIIFTSGPLQVFTLSGKFCIQLARRWRWLTSTKLRFCQEVFALKVACYW